MWVGLPIPLPTSNIRYRVIDRLRYSLKGYPHPVKDKMMGSPEDKQRAFVGVLEQGKQRCQEKIIEYLFARETKIEVSQARGVYTSKTTRACQ